MINSIIFVDGKPYLGEDLDKTYPNTNNSTSGQGWYPTNNGDLSILLFGDDKETPLQIEGMRNLKTHLDRILVRMKEGVLVVNNINIKLSQ